MDEMHYLDQDDPESQRKGMFTASISVERRSFEEEKSDGYKHEYYNSSQLFNKKKQKITIHPHFFEMQ